MLAQLLSFEYDQEDPSGGWAHGDSATGPEGSRWGPGTCSGGPDCLMALNTSSREVNVNFS